MPTNLPTLTRVVLATFASVIAFVIIAFGGLTWAEFSRTSAAADNLATARAQLVSNYADWVVTAGEQTLESADRLAGDSFPNVAADHASDIEALVQPLPGDAQLSFSDLGGTVVFSTNPDVTAGTDIALTQVLSVPPTQPYISALTSSGSRAAKYFMISQAVQRNGKNVGIATLHIPAEAVLSGWSKADTGPNSTVSLIRNDGWLVTRSPLPDGPLDLSKYVLFTDYLKHSSEGTYDATSPLDGKRRVVAYRRVPNAPLIAIASADTQFVMKPFWNYVFAIGALGVCLLGISFIALAWVWRLLKAEELTKKQLADSANRSALLLREIHHRVKNNLQIVASLIRLQPMDPGTKRDLSARILAMSAVHEQSYKRDQFGELELQDYLKTLIDNVKKTLGPKIVIESNLTPMTIDHDTALPLGLIANEVISNAAKHAFKDKVDPQITVDLRWAEEQGFGELRVHDNGVGYTESSGEKGMGARLIKAFGQQLGGKYSYELSDGTLFTVKFKVIGS